MLYALSLCDIRNRQTGKLETIILDLSQTVRNFENRYNLIAVSHREGVFNDLLEKNGGLGRPVRCMSPDIQSAFYKNRTLKMLQHFFCVRLTHLLCVYSSIMKNELQQFEQLHFL